MGTEHPPTWKSPSAMVGIRQGSPSLLTCPVTIYIYFQHKPSTEILKFNSEMLCICQNHSSNLKRERSAAYYPIVVVFAW